MDWRAAWEFVVLTTERFWKLFTGGGLVIAGIALYERSGRPVSWPIYFTAIATCVILALFYQGVAQYKRLMPRIVVRALRNRTWSNNNGMRGEEYWIDIYNPSEARSLESVRAELTEMSPDPFGYLPVPLHIKHDFSYEEREFSINPTGSGMVDILTGPSDSLGSQRYIRVPHTIGGGWQDLDLRDYELTITVSAKDVPAVRIKVKAWVGEEGKLKCIQL